MERDEMVKIARKIQQGDYVDDDDLDQLLDVLRRETGSPHVSDLIFWPNHAIPGRRVDQELTAEEVVDHALNHRPFAL